ncbi:hypothetical protein F8M41_015373 [Gigaspora margarita]|uniref:Uncharacterized protein n=1 Tax=Gigaspora margarita TaxID=4874 RepID=A0A8H4AQV1_GIGMA|nr:hypothetical protein F8M41_015373 [Gigaspora margarita]
MPSKKNFSPCAIENCQYNTSKFQVLDDKICIPKQDFLNLVSNIKYLQENQKDEIFEKIIENTEAINEDIENINENNTSNEINFATKLQLLTLVIYNQQRKFENNPEYNLIKFKQMLEQNEPKLIGFFDELVEDIGLHLALAETSYRGIDILSNTGFTVSSKTVLRYKQQIVKDHFKKIYCLYIFNLDDSYSIHEIRRPNDTFLSSTKHFATCTAKKINFLTPILANYNNITLFNPISYSTFEIDKFESIDNLTIHLYDDAILEYKEERSIKDLQLVDFKELELHSFENYADAFKMIINVPNHLIII